MTTTATTRTDRWARPRAGERLGGPLGGVAVGREDVVEQPGDVVAGPGLLREDGARPAREAHRGLRGVAVDRACGRVLDDPEVAVRDVPPAGRQAEPGRDPAGVVRGDVHRPGGGGDPETLEPGAHVRGRAALEDRRLPDPVDGGVVRREGDEVEVAVLQGDGCAEQRGGLVDDGLQVGAHATPRAGRSSATEPVYGHLSAQVSRRR